MSERPIRVLLIEDNPGDARLIQELLTQTGFRFESEVATTLAAGIALAGVSDPEVILLDLTLPDSSALETFTRLQSHHPEIPIVVLTGISDETMALDAVHAGAQDYLVKGEVDGKLLGRSLRYAIERKRTESARREAEERLRENEKLLKEAQQIAHLGSWEWDVRTNHVRWSDELYRIYDLDPRESPATFEAYLAWVHPDDRERTRATISAALQNHQPFDFEERILRPDGSVRTLRSRGEIIPDAGGNVARMVGACEDITERKEVEVELARARDAALQSAKLKSAFLANMSHEIRTPLNVILGYNAVIAEEYAAQNEERRTALVEGVERAAQRLMATIDGILDISKLETGNFDVRPIPLLLRTVIERQLEDFHALATEKGLSLSSAIEEPDAVVQFDDYCLSHALMNLLQNAIKFTAQGGVSLHLFRDEKGLLCLDVEDTGIGIDPSYLPRLFEPFSQEEVGYSRRYEGSGLGLTLTREYLSRNGATISVESVKRKGTIFHIRFSPESEVRGFPPPVNRARSRSAQPREPSPSEKPLILVVEDDVDTQDYMREVLGKHYRVLIAASGAEARNLLETHRDGILMVLMDLSLRGKEDGLMLTEFLREHGGWKNIPIIATTAHAFPEDRRRALDAGCNGYLAKPIRRSELLALMDDLLRARGTVDRERLH